MMAVVQNTQKRSSVESSPKAGASVTSDMAAAVWFSYLLLYLQEAEGLSATQAGGVMFAGQLADAIATPLVGLASDATRRGCCGLGRRKSWNLAGVVVVAANFFLVFGTCALCAVTKTPSTPARAASLAVFAALFNVGWAAVQVSHMTMVPELTRDEVRARRAAKRSVFEAGRGACARMRVCALVHASPPR